MIEKSVADCSPCDSCETYGLGELEKEYDGGVIEIAKILVARQRIEHRRLAGKLKENLKRDVDNILAWSVFGPCLAIWPMVSALPAISLFAGQDSQVQTVSQVLLLATGFWGLSLGTAALWYMASFKARSGFRSSPRKLGLPLAIYASAWMVLYLWISYAL